MLKNRLIISLTFKDGVLFRTKKFRPDYRYTTNFINLWSIDELILIDLSEKKMQESFFKTIEYFSKNCFVPITVGGGINSLEDADLYFKLGADKILLSSKSILKTEFLINIQKKYGVQSIIQAIDFKRENEDEYSIYHTNAKHKLTINVKEFLIDIQKIGIGEILFNNIDNDGGLLGYDINFLKKYSGYIKCPSIALGGCGTWSHILELFRATDITAAATQNIYHFTETSLKSAKNYLINEKINIRV